MTGCGPSSSQRYITLVMKYFVHINVFMPIMNFPTYILSHSLPVILPHSQYSTLHMISFVCDLVRPWLHYLREFRWEISVTHELLIQHHYICSIRGLRIMMPPLSGALICVNSVAHFLISETLGPKSLISP